MPVNTPSISAAKRAPSPSNNFSTVLLSGRERCSLPGSFWIFMFFRCVLAHNSVSNERKEVVKSIIRLNRQLACKARASRCGGRNCHLPLRHSLRTLAEISCFACHGLLLPVHPFSIHQSRSFGFHAASGEDCILRIIRKDAFPRRLAPACPQCFSKAFAIFAALFSTRLIFCAFTSEIVIAFDMKGRRYTLGHPIHFNCRATERVTPFAGAPADEQTATPIFLYMVSCGRCVTHR